MATQPDAGAWVKNELWSGDSVSGWQVWWATRSGPGAVAPSAGATWVWVAADGGG